ncbi:hypothetical protein POM88_009950 [Heracleum sosnowskyi]|uniref:Ubiquitin-like protease family profile domain-containing protein n=1 Tax=Heracleum sosnowskyi TaxID=360622 RepID=A0AAD8J990_9APIA|nr:hypothetical protein POM88_009950 [Heracleum sosnowskyi]
MSFYTKFCATRGNKNLFVHFDSIEGGPNTPSALKHYEALKEFMGPGGESLRPRISSTLRKKQRKKKKSVTMVSRGLKATVPPVTGESEATGVSCLPVFMECTTTPQQSNGYDCGLYVLAIARAICQWDSDMISTIEKNVDYSVEMKMRREVLDIIQEMATDH